MPKESAGSWRGVLFIAVASATLAAYVIPFDWGNIGKTQATQSTYENLDESASSIRDRLNTNHNDLRDTLADDRTHGVIENAQQGSDQKF